MVLSDLIAPKQFKAARVAARSGRYELLLGAGASMGAVNTGGELPAASGLVNLLRSRFPAAPIDEDSPLPRAYQRALLVTNPDEMWRWLQTIFADAQPLGWHIHLASLPWRRAWTLNVDNVFERAYARTERAKYMALRSISWDEPFAQTGDLEVIHLHGHVLGKETRRLVFSFAEYQTAAAERPVWDQVLAAQLGATPMVVVGASLLGDPDVERLLMNNRPTDAAPSIVVDPYITPGNKWELDRLGYVVVQMTGQDFAMEWSASFELDSVAAGQERAWSTVPQFERLQTNVVLPPPRHHEYYEGDAPLWADAVANRPALFDWTRTTITKLEEWLDTSPRPSRLMLLYASRLAGVSSGLLMLAREARSKGCEVLWFNRAARWDAGRIIDLLRGGGPCVLLVESAADFADDVDKLLRAAADEESVELLVVASELPYNDLKLEGRLGGSYHIDALNVPQRLTRKSAHALVEKLQSAGRLGALELQAQSKRLSHFTGRDVFSAMMEVEHAAGFKSRVEGELRHLDADWKRDLIQLLAFASSGHKEVGVADASIAVGRSASTVIDAVRTDESLLALVEMVDNVVLARQRTLVLRPLVDLRGRDAALNSLVGCVTRLAPLATRESLRQRNRASLLVGHLMAYKQLQENFLSDDIESFYDRLHPVFGDWSARYWEQRSILAKDTENWPKAESYAARAVTLYDDAFTRTTYGTILINKAEYLLSRRDAAWAEFYVRGREELALAGAKERGNRISAFAYLEATVKMLETAERDARFLDDEKQLESLLEALEDWRSNYNLLRVGLTDAEGLTSVGRAEHLSRRWSNLRLARDSSSPSSGNPGAA